MTALGVIPRLVGSSQAEPRQFGRALRQKPVMVASWSSLIVGSNFTSLAEQKLNRLYQSVTQPHAIIRPGAGLSPPTRFTGKGLHTRDRELEQKPPQRGAGERRRRSPTLADTGAVIPKKFLADCRAGAIMG
ncbi:hypothetical protein LZ31DRAFT_557145 [Colletotrichum somersetense]|nr:hypothetical protein LZ31DRAFT_557145 [Colletotrichum somersetense]